MKNKVQTAILSSFAFLVLAAFYPGFVFESGEAIFLATAVFALLQIFVRPVLKLLSLPLNLITFGLFSLFITVIILYILSFLVPSFKIVSYDLSTLDILGWQITPTQISPLLSALIASFMLGLISSVFFWILA